MKVHLITTSNYAQSRLKEVCDYLNFFSGYITYTIGQVEIPLVDHHIHQFAYPSHTTALTYNNERNTPLSFNELFMLCNNFRSMNTIANDDFVILLTDHPNALNWFSAINNSKDAFINTQEWNLYYPKHEKYAIAYQIIEKITQSLMGIDYTQPNHPNIHNPIKGCMNDFCSNKEQVIIKMKTADICESCKTLLTRKKAKISIVNQIDATIEDIRSISIAKHIESPNHPFQLVVDKDYRILIDNVHLLDIGPIHKTLYLFFLQHPEGVARVNLDKHIDFFIALYKMIRTNADNESASNRMKNLVDYGSNKFNESVSIINKTLKDLLGEELAEHYKISGIANQPYRIKLPKDLIDIRF